MPSNKVVSFWPKGSRFSDLLKMYRDRANLSQNELAILLGFNSARMIQHWEKESLPRSKNLKKLIEVFFEHKIFLPGQELEEATQLWNVVKNNYEADLNNYKTYQLLDRRWLERLLREKSSSTEQDDNLLPEVPPTPPVILPSGGKFTPQLVKPEVVPAKNPPLPVVATPEVFEIPASKHNLPFQITSFIGRSDQIQEIGERLNKNRFLTLVGPGGIGKTRLAIEVARRLLALSEFEDGAWLVELAALTDASMVAQTILQSLGLDEEPHRPALATVIDYFKTKRALLILDNCEQLDEDWASLPSKLLESCPKLCLLATSRIPGRIFGQQLWQVPALSLPDLEEQVLPEAQPDPMDYEAIQLFVERARAVRSEFSLQELNLASLQELCRYLDGMPLAIELAAARVNILSLEQITGRLQNSLNLLKTDSKFGIPTRQQTMHAAIEWSYGLLSEVEQTMLKQLAIFAGGCTIEAIEAVCEVETNDTSLLDLMNLLVTKSLVAVDHSVARKLGAVRYRLLETVRQYGLELLGQDEVQPKTLQKRYADYYLQFVEEAETGLRGPQMELWLSRLKSEYGNVRAVLNWSLATGELALAARIVGALGWFWYTMSYIQEGRQWLDKILPRKAAVSLELHPRLLTAAGAISFLQSELEEAHQLHQEALALSQKIGDWWHASFSLGSLAIQLAYMGRFEEAVKIAEDSLAVAHRSGDLWLIIDQHFTLISSLTHLGQLEKAQTLAKECLRLNRKLGNKQMQAYTYLYVGKLYKALPRLGQALHYLEDSLAIWQGLGERRMALDAVISLSEVFCAQKKFDQARELLITNLRQSEEVGNPHLIARSLQALGMLSLQTKSFKEATDYLEQSLTLFEQIGDRLGQVLVSRTLAQLEKEADPDELL